MANLKMQCRTHNSFSNTPYTNSSGDLIRMSKAASAHRQSTGSMCIIDVFEITTARVEKLSSDSKLLFTLHPEQ